MPLGANAEHAPKKSSATVGTPSGKPRPAGARVKRPATREEHIEVTLPEVQAGACGAGTPREDVEELSQDGPPAPVRSSTAKSRTVRFERAKKAVAAPAAAPEGAAAAASRVPIDDEQGACGTPPAYTRVPAGAARPAEDDTTGTSPGASSGRSPTPVAALRSSQRQAQRREPTAGCGVEGRPEGTLLGISKGARSALAGGARRVAASHAERVETSADMQSHSPIEEGEEGVVAAEGAAESEGEWASAREEGGEDDGGPQGAQATPHRAESAGREREATPCTPAANALFGESLLIPAQREYLRACSPSKRLLVAPTGFGKTMLGTVAAFRSLCGSGVVLFLSMTKATMEEHTRMLGCVATGPKQGIVVTSAAIFFQLWKRARRGEETTLIPNVAEALREVATKVGLAIVLDEAHIVLAEKRGERATHLAQLRDALGCQLFGLTATFESANEEWCERARRLFGEPGTGEASNGVHACPEKLRRDWQKQLPCTPALDACMCRALDEKWYMRRQARSGDAPVLDLAALRKLVLHEHLCSTGAVPREDEEDVRALDPRTRRELLREVVEMGDSELVNLVANEIRTKPMVRVSRSVAASVEMARCLVTTINKGNDFETDLRYALDELLDAGGSTCKSTVHSEYEHPERKHEAEKERGRVFAVCSSIGSGRYVSKFVERVLAACAAPGDDGETTDSGDPVVYDLHYVALLDHLDDLLHTTFVEKQPVLLVLSQAMLTGTNILNGIVDTLVTVGTFSRTARQQVRGRISERPLSGLMKPDRVVHLHRAGSPSSVHLLVDDYLRELVEWEHLQHAHGTRARKRTAKPLPVPIFKSADRLDDDGLRAQWAECRACFKQFTQHLSVKMFEVPTDAVRSFVGTLDEPKSYIAEEVRASRSRA